MWRRAVAGATAEPVPQGAPPDRLRVSRRQSERELWVAVGSGRTRVPGSRSENPGGLHRAKEEDA